MKQIIIVLLFVLSCASNRQRDMIPTGVETRRLEGGSIEIRVTARASQNALEKNSAAMKMDTCREAAGKMLALELKKEIYVNTAANYKTGSVDFMNDFEYCRINGIYNPAGFEVQLPSDKPAGK